ncbi:NAD(P)-binding domain-containing protein (plasmid) [Mesorhizobium atlanticum]|uniref:NAD(P)-binding domain-containing protein n=1 Tax=Mesorhizobium atlanticum TaxID=2233532 RepID=UPI00370379FB
MTVSMPRTDCEVAVIGAGPFGLAAASALKAAGVDTLTFGGAMSFWRDHMPRGMRLRSPWHATYVGYTKGPLSLDSYAKVLGISPREPLLLQNFVDYGLWIQTQAVPDLDIRRVSCVETAKGGFCLVLADGNGVRVRRVVVATGLMNQQLIPAAFNGMPRELVSHASEHTGYESFRGKRVAVIGRGQSACRIRRAAQTKRGRCRTRLPWRHPLVGVSGAVGKAELELTRLRFGAARIAFQGRPVPDFLAGRSSRLRAPVPRGSPGQAQQAQP